MKIIGFSIQKLSIERKNPIKGKMEIKSNVNLDSISKEENQVSEKSVIKFDFAFSVVYSPSIANIEIKGSVLGIDDKNEEKEIIKQWKEKKLSDSFRIPLFNFILDKCNMKALELEDELGLPFHVPFPKISVQKKQESQKALNYTG